MGNAKVVLSMAVVLLGATALGFAQRGPGGRGMRGYDPATEVTLTAAVVDEVKNVPGPANGPGGLHLLMHDKAGPVEVVLGPAAFVTGKSFEFAKGDTITVIGSRGRRAGQEVLIAREVTKGDKVLTLRDASGRPMWAGGSRR